MGFLAIQRATMLSQTIHFLNHIGLPTAIVDETPKSSFMPHLFIRHGTLEVTRDVLIGDLLHDAGHLAVIPGRLRHLMHGNLYRSFEAIFEQIADLPHDHPEVVAMIHSDDPAATAWAWACGVHLGIPHEDIITDASFGDAGADIRCMLSHHQYVGIHALQSSGFCAAHGMCHPTLPVFPQLQFWVKD